MIKWPWKAHQAQAGTFAEWQEALAIPLLSPLDETEQRRLVAVASQILQNKRILPLQGLELTCQTALNFDQQTASNIDQGSAPFLS